VSESPIVRLENLSKKYGDQIALSSVDLSIERKEFITLLGPSGSGKTTMLHLIAGLVAPTDGKIWINGVDATDMPPRQRGLGMVFQNYALLPHMTIFDNVAFPLRVRKRPRNEIDDKVMVALNLVQIGNLKHRKPNQISGGQQQRAAIARCIVYAPAITLMDEPLGALDKKLREQMQLELKKLHAQLGMTLLYVTHDQQEALTMSDRIVLMNVGRIEQIGSPSDLYFNPVSIFAAEFLGDSNLLAGVILEAGAPIRVRIGGDRIVAAQRGAAVRPGQTVRLMVRPENVRLLRNGREEPHQNRLAGVVADTIIMGGIVKHYIRLPDESLLVVQELNRGGQAIPTPGQKAELAWSADDTIVFPDEKNAVHGRKLEDRAQ
jgi:putative spermidine/putrescine transport system ATP-binding protein